MSASVFAGPLVLEESARLVSPDPEFPLNDEVAVDGDFIIASAERYDPQTDWTHRRGYLFRRSGSGWAYVRTLFSGIEESPTIGPPIPVALAMKDGIAAIRHPTEDVGARLSVFQRSGADYVQVPSTGDPDATDLEISDGTIVASDETCSYDAETYRRDASGTWVKVGGGEGVFRYCDDEFMGGDVAISGNTFIVGDPADDNPPEFPAQAHVFTGVQGTPTEQVLLSPDEGTMFGHRVALEGNIALVSGSNTSGEYVFTGSAALGWFATSRVRPVDAFAAGFPNYLELENGWLLRPRAQDDGAVGIFRRAPTDEWDHLANLVPSVGRLTGRSADSSGHRVVAQGEDAVYVWDLPSDFSQPERRHYDFQEGSAAAWSPQPGSDFAVVAGTDSTVYRQRSLAGNATALLNTTAWRNQSIQADIIPVEFQAADRWLGLAVRYTDANNYYYVTLRQSNSLQLRRIVNGTFQTLASVPMSVTPGRSYNVRLEAIGATLRVYVDGRMLLRVRDQAHAQGRAGLMTYRTRADFDNVIVSANPRTTLMSDNFEFTAGNNWWTTEGIGLWNIVADGTSRVYEQSSVADGARAVTGVNTAEDQIIEARAKATVFGPGTGRWFGLMARYQDANNYYYITVRNDNTVSLRKLVDGTIVVLDTAPLTVSTGTWYSLRLEAIDDSLRAYVNGRLVLEAQDSSFAQGAYGIAMYKAAVRIDDFKATQP